MIRALRSSFFRFFSTGLFIKSLIFSVILAFFQIFRTCTEDLGLLPFQQPRYVNNNFIMMNMLTLIYVVPFGIALFASIHTGSDIQFRSINNKITTGVSRTSILLSDLIVTVLSAEFSIVLQLLIFYLYARFVPVKSNISVSGLIINSTLGIMVICAAFSAVFVLVQFFSSNKLLALILTLLILPTINFSSQMLEARLTEPYRLYQYEEDENGEQKVTGWTVNPNYIGGTPRTILKFVYDTSPYSFYFFESDKVSLKTETEAAGIVFLAATALGVLSINKKEYP